MAATRRRLANGDRVFTAVQYPYVLKFLWAPVVERYPLTSLGRRRSWMPLSQIALIFSIGSLGFWQPKDAMTALVVISIGLAFFSATQDVVLDAFRREILDTDGELALATRYMCRRIALPAWCQARWV